MTVLNISFDITVSLDRLKLGIFYDENILNLKYGCFLIPVAEERRYAWNQVERVAPVTRATCFRRQVLALLLEGDEHYEFVG